MPRMTVNGEAVEAAAEPRLLLSDFLRHTLGLTGTHVGCEHGVCGACTVLIDGRAGAVLPGACGSMRGRGGGDGGGAGGRPAAGRLPPAFRAAMRLLHGPAY